MLSHVWDAQTGFVMNSETADQFSRDNDILCYFSVNNIVQRNVLHIVTMAFFLLALPVQTVVDPTFWKFVLAITPRKNILTAYI